MVLNGADDFNDTRVYKRSKYRSYKEIRYYSNREHISISVNGQFLDNDCIKNFDLYKTYGKDYEIRGTLGYSNRYWYITVTQFTKKSTAMCLKDLPQYIKADIEKFKLQLEIMCIK